MLENNAKEIQKYHDKCIEEGSSEDQVEESKIMDFFSEKFKNN